MRDTDSPSRPPGRAYVEQPFTVSGAAAEWRDGPDRAARPAAVATATELAPTNWRARDLFSATEARVARCAPGRPPARASWPSPSRALPLAFRQANTAHLACHSPPG